MSCQNCPCASCLAERARKDPYDGFTDYGTPGPAPGVDRWTGERQQEECSFDRIAREYKAKGQPMPTAWLLHCPCKRCNPVSF